MRAQKSLKGRLSAAQETRELPAPRGHVRKLRKPGSAVTSDKGIGKISRKAASYLRLKTGRNPPHTTNIVKPSRYANKKASS